MRRRVALAGLIGALLAACAPRVQTRATTPPTFTGPHFTDDALISFDGACLPMKVWPATGSDGMAVEPWAVIVALHGMNDHHAAFTLPGPYLASHGITVYAYDQRGFGQAPHRGVWGGTALMTQDLRAAVALARAAHPYAVVAVLGESMGGAVAIAAFASADPPAADRVILASPAVWGWDAQPIPNRIALWLTAHIAPSSRLEPPRLITDHIQASDNIEELRRMGRDPGMIFTTRTDTIYGLVNLMQQAREEIGQVKAPMLDLYGAHDQIIPKNAAFYAARRLSPTARSAYYAHGYHLLTRDLGRQVVLDDLIAFIRDPKAPLPSGAPPIPHGRQVRSRTGVTGPCPKGAISLCPRA
jgi:alpha-beta hydrolase superfamily lysophospholipase